MNETQMNDGQRIGDYSVITLIGKGGMGEVYQARDSRLGRDVAIKVLPDSFAADPDRIARFDREARLLAALNHPNIATIHGIEDHEGRKILVLELVEGQALNERLMRGRIPLDEALNLAMQITEALEAAHEKGVVHRDLKPANIKIRPDGQLKVLDFGLAKAIAGNSSASDAALSPTVSIAATEKGVLLGTAPYMSPEQARGEEVDRRADIWAFGCVLYEMLTGLAAFDRPTATESLARVLEGSADLERLPQETPTLVVRLIRRCLEKNVRNRLQHIGDARLELIDAMSETTDEPASRSRRTFVVIAGTAAASVAGGFVAGSRFRPAAEAPPDSSGTAGIQATFEIVPPNDEIHMERETTGIAISRDGAQVYFTTSDAAGIFHVYARALRETDVRQLREGVPVNLFVSPNGESIVTGRHGNLFRTSMRTGRSSSFGPAFDTANDTERGRIRETFGSSWGRDNRIFVGTDTPGGLLMFRASSDAAADEVSPPDTAAGDAVAAEISTPATDAGERNHAWPHVLPNRDVLFNVIRSGPITGAEIAVLGPEAQSHRRLGIYGTNPRYYAASGHIVFGFSGTLQAVEYDIERRETVGEPVQVRDDVRTTSSGMAAFDVSENGTLIYLTGGAIPEGTVLARIDRDGNGEVLETIGRRKYHSVRASPTDDNVLAVQIEDPESGDEDIHLVDLDRGFPDPLTRDSGVNAVPLFTRDGESLVFASKPHGDEAMWGLYSVRIAAPYEVVPVGDHRSTNRLMPMGWGPDDRTLVFMDGGDIAYLSMDEPSQIRYLLRTPAQEGWGSTSADGDWVAYASTRSEGWQTYVGPFDGLDTRRNERVSPNGGYYPLISRDRSRIYYYSRDRRAIWVAPVTLTEDAIDVGIARRFFEGSPLPASTPPRPYDEMRDGSIVTILSGRGFVEPTPAPRLIVDVGWGQRVLSRLPRAQ